MAFVAWLIPWKRFLPFLPHISGGLGIALLLALAWGARVNALRGHYKQQLATLTVQIQAVGEITKATDKTWRRTEQLWAADAARLEEERKDEMARLDARADALAAELRKRPMRPARSAAAAQGAAAGVRPAPAGGCTGAELYREDAEFLLGEARRADAIRTALNQCIAQYDKVAQ